MNAFVFTSYIRGLYLESTFSFHKTGVFVFLKIITVILFLWLALIMDLITLVLSMVNALFGSVLIIGFITSPIAGFFHLLTMFCYALCNAFEWGDFMADAREAESLFAL
jgi:hypothetical protein